MMRRVRDHAAANAKAMAIYGQLLDQKDYQALIDLNQLDDIVGYLKLHTHYAQAFEATELSIERYEIRMKRYFFSAYDKLCYFYFDAYRDFFKSLMLRYEVENIKLLAREVLRQDDSINLEAHLLHSSFDSGLNYPAIAESKDLQGFMGALEGTRYYAAIKPFVADDPRPMVFRIEMALDRLYFQQLYQSIRSLERDDRELMIGLLAINIDVLNLQWIYRGRRYFDISPEELLNFTLAHGKKYTVAKLKDFCYMEFEDFKTMISLDEYGDLFKDREYMLESAMERYLYRTVKKLFQKARLSLAVPVCLLFMFEYELRDLFTIMEAKKSGFQAVEEYLIRDLGRE